MFEGILLETIEHMRHMGLDAHKEKLPSPHRRQVFGLASGLTIGTQPPESLCRTIGTRPRAKFSEPKTWVQTPDVRPKQLAVHTPLGGIYLCK